MHVRIDAVNNESRRLVARVSEVRWTGSEGKSWKRSEAEGILHTGTGKPFDHTPRLLTAL